MNINNLVFEIDGRKYTWLGGFGGIIKSYEDGLHKGDVRYIAGHLFTVYMVAREWHRFGGREVSWTFARENVTIEAFRAFKHHLFD